MFRTGRIHNTQDSRMLHNVSTSLYYHTNPFITLFSPGLTAPSSFFISNRQLEARQYLSFPSQVCYPTLDFDHHDNGNSRSFGMSDEFLFSLSSGEGAGILPFIFWPRRSLYYECTCTICHTSGIWFHNFLTSAYWGLLSRSWASWASHLWIQICSSNLTNILLMAGHIVKLTLDLDCRSDLSVLSF